ncbi:MAG: lytic transglycosylase domain-containing protein [Fretibacterium sp.]|nr:lytic transglycosylase domain-containing protein [Fretibacterium sp.]
MSLPKPLLRTIAESSLCLYFLLLPVTAGAKPGKFELPPPSEDDRIIRVDLLPKFTGKKADSGSPSNAKQREARIRSIAELFSRYNRKLSKKQARQYAEYVLQAGEKFGQDPFVLASIVVHESAANAAAVSRGGDYGLMQVRWRIHKKRIMKEYPSVKKAKDFLDPKINILMGTEILRDCRAAAGSDLRAGLLRYSAGNKKLAHRILATKKTLEDAYKKHLRTLK